MGLGLLAPWALLALASLALPLLLHLHRRVQRTPLRFAALRWLRPLQRPRRRLRLERPWLLLLRLLLAALLVLLLAEPVWRDERSGPAWVLLHPALDRALLEQTHGDIETRWWAEGFAPVDQPAPEVEQPYASLLRQLDARIQPDTALQVWLPPELSGLDGTLLRLQREVDWRIVEAGTSLPAEPDVASSADAPAWLIWRGSDPPAGAEFVAAAAQALAGLAETATDAEVLSSADGIHRLPQRPVALRSLAAPEDFNRIEPTTTVLIWLDSSLWPAAIESWLRAGGTIYWSQACADCSDADGWLRVWHSDDAARALWAGRVGNGRLLRPSVALQPATFPELLDGSFPALLADWLGEPRREAQRAPAGAMRPVRDGPAGRVPPRALEDWLLPLIALLLLGERTLALWPRKRTDADDRAYLGGATPQARDSSR